MEALQALKHHFAGLGYDQSVIDIRDRHIMLLNNAVTIVGGNVTQADIDRVTKAYDILFKGFAERPIAQRLYESFKAEGIADDDIIDYLDVIQSDVFKRVSKVLNNISEEIGEMIGDDLEAIYNALQKEE
jgi:hypothetical protein